MAVTEGHGEAIIDTSITEIDAEIGTLARTCKKTLTIPKPSRAAKTEQQSKT